jgi:hypothetical protein
MERLDGAASRSGEERRNDAVDGAGKPGTQQSRGEPERHLLMLAIAFADTFRVVEEQGSEHAQPIL